MTSRLLFTSLGLLFFSITMGQEIDLFHLDGKLGKWTLTNVQVIDSISELPVDTNLAIHINKNDSSFVVQKRQMKVVNYFVNENFVCAELERINHHRSIYVLLNRNDSLKLKPFILVNDKLEERIEFITLLNQKDLDVYFINNGQLIVKISNRQNLKGSKVHPLLNDTKYYMKDLDLLTIRKLVDGDDFLHFKSIFEMMNQYNPL